MKNITGLFLLLILLACNQPSDKSKANDKSAKDQNIIAGKVEQLANGFGFTEGPAADSLGHVYFTDIPNDQILIWRTENKLDTFRLKSGNANGLYFDDQGKLLVCEGGKGRIAAYSPDGNYQVLVSSYQSNRFNQPNDLWPDKRGGIYFTDPKYAGENPELYQDGEHVYYIQPDRSNVIRVEDELKKPNGILGTPNGKTLYITDTSLEKTFAYNIKSNGNLSNKELLIDKGSDGMTLDKNGNLYLTTVGNSHVDVYSPKGQLLTSIEVPEVPSNVCFGGKDRSQLYITARTSIYRIDTNVQGVD